MIPLIAAGIVQRLRRDSLHLLGGLLFLAATIAGNAALAQNSTPTPAPIRTSIDQNGVDLSSGEYKVDTNELSIGSGATALRYRRSLFYHGVGGVSWTNNFVISVGFVPGPGDPVRLVVSFPDKSYTFTQVGSNYQSDQGEGVSLQEVGSNFIFTDGSGVVYTFDKNLSYYLYNFRYGSTDSYTAEPVPVVSIRSPSNEILTFSYKTFSGSTPYMRLQGVVSTAGYEAKFYYTNATSTIISSVSLLNNAIDYCDPAADSCSGTSQAWPTVTYGTTQIPSETVNGENWIGVDVATVADPMGRSTRYTTGFVNTGVDGSGHMTGYHFLRVKRPGSATDNVVVKADPYNRMASINRDGLQWQYNWSITNSQVTGGTITDALSHVRSFSSDPAQQVILSSTDPLTRKTTYSYDTLGRLTKETAPEGNYVQYTYDTRGNVTNTASVAKAGSGLADISTSAVFPATCDNSVTCNQPTSTTDARGNTTVFTYDPTHGGVLTATAPAVNGVSPQQRNSYSALYAYYKNASGTLVAGSAPIYVLSGTSQCRNLASCAGMADELKTTVSYGAPGTANNLLPTSASVSSGDGAITVTRSTTYDAVGNRLTATDQLGRVMRYRYDADREVVGMVGPDPDGSGPLKNRAVRTTYNADGLVVLREAGVVASQSDPDWANFLPLRAFATSYDAADRKATEGIRAGGTVYSLTQYSYDGAGRLDCVAQRMNSDAFGSAPAACSLGTPGNYGPDRIARTTYDDADEVLKKTTSYGVTGAQRDIVSYTYSLNGKVKSLADAKGNLTSYLYDGFDRLSQTQYPSPSSAGSSNTADYEQLGYDADGNVVTRRLRDGTSIGYAYDALNRVSTKTLPNGEMAVSYTYDNRGHPKLISGASNLTYTYDGLARLTGETQANGSVAYQYDLAGRRTRLTWQDGAYLSYDYDAADEMTVIHEGNGSALATYAFDDLGKRISRTLGNGTSISYGYDVVSRLTALASSGGSDSTSVTLANYSPAGEIGARTNTNDAYAWTQTAAVSRPYTANGLNQFATVAGVTQGYDARGNLTNSQGVTFAYTSENLLKSVSSGANLYYDPVGRLQQYDTPGSLRFVYDGGAISEETDASGNVLRRYVFGPAGDEPIVWYEGSAFTTKRYLDQDERGSVTRITNQDGSTFAINSYDEFGIPGGSNQGRFGYTGQAWLSEIGLNYFKARMYSPTWGRFLQSDLIGFGDGTNLYNYARSNPLKYVDPTGLSAAKKQKNPNSGDEIPNSGTAVISNGVDAGKKVSYVVSSYPAITRDSSGTRGYYSQNTDGTLTFNAGYYAPYIMTLAVPIGMSAAYTGAGYFAVGGSTAVATEGGEATIGDILAGSHPDTMVHLTNDSASAFASGVDEGTFFARLGDVSEMTVEQYQSDVVGMGAAAGPGQPVSGFIAAAPGNTGAFGQAGVWNNAGVMEYTNGARFIPHSYVPLP